MRIHGKTPKLRLQTIDALKVVTPGWLFDRYSILRLKVANYNKDSAAYRTADLNLQTINNICKSLMENKPTNKLGIMITLKNNLEDINKKLWKLEDDIRKTKDPSVVAPLALQIIESNDRRCQIVKEIDELFGYGADEKVYK
jgi:hypothetical protein